MERNLTLLVLLLFGVLRASAQCCCSDILVHVSLEDLPFVHSEREFEVQSLDEHHGSHLSDRDSTDHRLMVRLDAGCGLAERRFAVTRKPTGERMELHVLFLGFDGLHPSLRVPFTPGVYEVDLEHLIGCAGVSDYQDLAPNDTLVPEKRMLDCGAGKLLHERDKHGVVLEPLELRSGGFHAGQVDGTQRMDGVAGYAEYPGGTSELVAQMLKHLSPARQAALSGRITYTGIGYVSPDGRCHARIGQEQAKGAYTLEMALLAVKGWLPARVLDQKGTEGWRPIGSMVRFSIQLPVE